MNSKSPLATSHVFILVISMFCSSCVLPIPHKRFQRPGVSTVVIDSVTKRPIPNATVTAEDESHESVLTDFKGHFTIPPKYGWHGAVVVFPPGPSLFPAMDLPYLSRNVAVNADGYDPLRSEYRARNPEHEWTSTRTIELKRKR